MTTARGEEAAVHVLDLADLDGSDAAEPERLPGLSDAERAEVRAYLGPRRRLAAAAARLLLRCVRLDVRDTADVRNATDTENAADVGDFGDESATYGELVRADGDFSVSHDGGTVCVARFPGGCGVDVEDQPEALFQSVRGRFCSEAEPLTHSARALWTAKEAAGKALGKGLAVGLRTLELRALPDTEWCAAERSGTACGLLVRTVAFRDGLWQGGGSRTGGRRHLSVAVRSTGPPALRLVRWTPGAGAGGLPLRPAGPLTVRAPVALARPDPQGSSGLARTREHASSVP